MILAVGWSAIERSVVKIGSLRESRIQNVRRSVKRRAERSSGRSVIDDARVVSVERKEEDIICRCGVGRRRRALSLLFSSDDPSPSSSSDEISSMCSGGESRSTSASIEFIFEFSGSFVRVDFCVLIVAAEERREIDDKGGGSYASAAAFRSFSLI